MTFEYDEVGNRKKRTDNMGRVTNYTFDNLNRLTKIEYAQDSANQTPKPQSTYGYDDISRLTSAVNEAGTVTFGYDNRNRVTSTTDVFNQALVYEYERTPTVNQKRLKLNGALYATYNFDNAERLENIVNASDGTTIGYTYFEDDAVKKRNYPNGVSTDYIYDNMRRLTRLTDTGPGGTLFDRNYAYNSANQISQITELTATRMFGYDNINRLTSVTGSVTESYLFDDVGNRTSSHRASSYGYQAGQFNRLTSAITPSQTLTYGFDVNGNTVSKSEGSNFWRYTWDYENRMAEAATRKQKVRYRYDALGRRVARNLGYGKENTKFTYDGDDVLMDDNAGTLTKYLNGDGLDHKLRQTIGSTASYFLTDHLGSTNGLSSSTGSLTASNSYDSFGNSTNASFSSRYQFTGREFDSFSGLQYSRARFYDPNLGRFITEDPIGLSGGINQYGYVRNNPFNATDPLGLYERDVHYYLTYYLARQTGCFSDWGAQQMAAGNQGVDDNPATAPGFGRDFTNSYYHALNANPGVGPSSMLPNLPYQGPSYFGQYLHYLQDTFSHRGYNNPYYGHGLGGHGPDKTASDVEKTVQMARVTYGAMSGYSQLKCGCKSKDWDNDMASSVRSFAGVSTNFPDFADIDGNIYGNFSSPYFASPGALNTKINFLGF